MGFLATTLWDWDFRALKGMKNGEGELQLEASPIVTREEMVN